MLKQTFCLGESDFRSTNYGMSVNNKKPSICINTTKHLSVTAGTCERRWGVHHEILEPGVGEAQFHDAVVKEAHGETAKANKRRQGSAWRK